MSLMNILSRLLLKPSYLHKVFTKYITKNHIQCWKETNKMLIYNKMMAEKIGSSIFLDLILLMILCYLIKTKAIERNNSNIIILLWDRPRLIPALDDEKWDSYFIYHGCRFQNCIITAESKFLSDIRDFDVIIFNSMIINETVGPETRSQKQNYVFFSDEPAAIYKVPKHFNGYFNMTWTYKLNSDATWRFMIVKNDDGEVIGPKENVMWTSFQHMKPTSEYIIQKLQTKHIAAAWFVTHCKTPSNRENMVERLINELDKYDLKIDIFGPCGSLTCTQNNEECHAVVESDYYFYLAFENSLCEDYVTEKILTALKHYTVPVVYGGADYSRFLPDGAYLDAKYLGPKRLARIMNKTIHDKEKYYDYFRWHSYYSFHAPNETAETDEICAFCALLNSKKLSRKISVIEDITRFWNPKSNEINPAILPDLNIQREQLK